MIVFWIAAGVLSAAAAGLILSRAAGAAAEGEAQDPRPILYRRQLAEIDDLAERGLLAEAERNSARAEAARRLLAAADAPTSAWTAGTGGRGAVLAAVAVAPALALVVYLMIGAPGAPDMPFAKRMQAWQATNPAELSAPELAAVLRKLTRERPNDPEGFRFLAIAEGASQNPPEAVRALRRGLKVAPDRADLWEMLGDALSAEAGDKLTDAAKAAYQEAVKHDPKLVVARFQLGRARIEGGDKAGGVAEWRTLMNELSGEDPRRAAIAEAIARETGQVQPQAAPAGAQMEMIRGMVQRLAQRLETNPDDAEGWVRLVRAYAVLGDTARRDDALKAARARYSGNSQVLQQLDEAAKAAPMQ